MSQPEQISTEQFDKYLEIYRNSSSAGISRISEALGRISRDELIPIRLALHLALVEEGLIPNEGIRMNDGAKEYEDILAGEKIYHETQKD